jgi:hypothetical protein
MSVDDLEAILADARNGNSLRGVTGALIYVDGVFLQILEGDKTTVCSLMKSIESDPRHNSVTVFHEGESPSPSFSHWKMAYLDATPDQLARWTGNESTTSLSEILQDLRADPSRFSQLAAGVLTALQG